MLWRDIIRSTERVSPTSLYNVSQAARCNDFKQNYEVGTKRMQFYGEISGSTGNRYSVIISFLDVEPTQGLDSIGIRQGRYPIPDLYKNEVQVRCGCPSYRFTGAVGNYSHRISTGPKFGRFIPAKTNRAGRNPNEAPMVCKHLIEFMNYLISEGLVQD